MAILASAHTQVIVQGITGQYARDQTRMMLAYGTNIIAGVVPGRGGEIVDSVPVYDAVTDVPVDGSLPVASIVYAPPAYALEAALEALSAEIELLVIPTERIPLHDLMVLKFEARNAGAWVVGPNTAGMIVPGQTLLGSIAPSYSAPGSIGVLSRSGTLTHESVRSLTTAGFGQSTSIHIGGDPVIGRNTVEYIRLFVDDPGTDALVLIGEIGGNLEEEAAEYLAEVDIPVVAFIAGNSAPPERRMGHAGALVQATRGSAAAKSRILERAGAALAPSPWEIPKVLQTVLGTTAAERA